MTMKKSLAAIAAATVAVSAMATTISASVNDLYDSTIAGGVSADSHSISFNLVDQDAVTNGVSVEAATFIEEVAIASLAFVKTGLDMADGNFSVEFSGKASQDDASLTIPINHYYTTDNKSKVGYDESLADDAIASGWVPSFVTDGYNVFTGTITIKYTATKTTVSDFNDATGGKTAFCIDLDGATATETVLLTATNVAEGGKTIKNYPFFTADNAVDMGTQDSDKNVFDALPYDVIERIMNFGAGINDYNQTAPYAAIAINDLLANYNDVTVTFKTAVDGVDKNAPKDDDNDGIADENCIPYKQSWQNMWDDGIIDYTVFGQNMYGNWGADTGYYAIPGFNWTNSNLFSAALVVNGDLTMAYNDVEAMEYGKKDISFNLTDILTNSGYGQAGAFGYGGSVYSGYIRSMQLMTTTDWYWDSVTFTGTQIAEAGDAGAGEGMTDEGGELEETPVETTAAEVVTVPETTAAPAVEPNPTTGSAPIALAVIPVAVAAAAIVAKKRK